MKAIKVMKVIKVIKSDKSYNSKQIMLNSEHVTWILIGGKKYVQYSILTFNTRIQQSFNTYIIFIFNTSTFNSHSILTFYTGSGIQQYSILTFQYVFNRKLFNSGIQQKQRTGKALTNEDCTCIHTFNCTCTNTIQYNTKFIENLLNWCVVHDTEDLHSGHR